VRRAPFVLLLLVAVAAACNDLHGYVGTWRGRPVDSALVRAGVAADAEAVLTLDSVERNQVSGALAVGDRAAVPLRPLPPAAADALGELSLPDGPLRTYLLAADGDTLAFISLYDDRVDLRLVRGDALYAVFRLRR
jgi:hypothetical protein